MGAVDQLLGANKVEIKQKTLEALRLLRRADQALDEVCKYFDNLTKDVETSRSTNTNKERKGELEMSSGELTRTRWLSESIIRVVTHLSKEGVVGCKAWYSGCVYSEQGT